jgi:hypothetical protein
MELDQETYKQIVENNVAMKAVSEKIDAFITETKCCLQSHDNRIREIEIRGSKPAEDAIAELTKIHKRITPLEAFVSDHDGQVKGVNWTTAIISGLIGATTAIIGIVFLIWDKVIH